MLPMLPSAFQNCDRIKTSPEHSQMPGIPPLEPWKSKGRWFPATCKASIHVEWFPYRHSSSSKGKPNLEDRDAQNIHACSAPKATQLHVTPFTTWSVGSSNQVFFPSTQWAGRQAKPTPRDEGRGPLALCGTPARRGRPTPASGAPTARSSHCTARPLGCLKKAAREEPVAKKPLP